MSNDLIKPAANAVVPATNNTGFSSNIGSEDIKFPRIELTQALSPSVQDGVHKQGILINSLTKEELPTPLTIIPCYVDKMAIKWRKREEGGGMVYKTRDFKNPEILKDLQWDGQQKPMATAYLNVVCMIPGQETPIVASFCNTGYKVGQDLLSLMVMSGKPWNYRYLLGSNKVSNSKGTFYVFTVKRTERCTPEEIEQAQLMSARVASLENLDMDYEGAEPDAPVPTAADINTKREF
jgi:hypothetical protein